MGKRVGRRMGRSVGRGSKEHGRRGARQRGRTAECHRLPFSWGEPLRSSISHHAHMAVGNLEVLGRGSSSWTLTGD